MGGKRSLTLVHSFDGSSLWGVEVFLRFFLTSTLIVMRGSCDPYLFLIRIYSTQNESICKAQREPWKFKFLKMRTPTEKVFEFVKLTFAYEDFT